MTVPATEEYLDARALPRVLPRHDLRDLGQHDEHFGECPSVDASLIDELERAGLRGHGGAAFPTATKWRAVAERRGPRVIVANGTEGEPASAKDKTLLSYAPHLVIDGAIAAAEAIGARDVILCVDRAAADVAAALSVAVAQRANDPRVRITLEATPSRYVSGEESALVAWLNGRDARPTFVPPRPFERGVRGRPTLVQNVETLAHVALVARFGAKWFRALGTKSDPGSTLLTCSGGFTRTGVIEVPLGLPMTALFEATRTDPTTVQALLVGGYFGTWIPADAFPRVRLSRASLDSGGASIGCGMVVALPHDACGLTETARITRWLASQTAGQCGPCVYGLDAIAGAMEQLVAGDHGGHALRDLHRWMTMVKGRGACKLPDGAIRLVDSALREFADEIHQHRRIGPCRGSRAPTMFPLPRPRSWR
jgi:NADH:ubiquinone oxidoreductase subunit F (NADH-binding)